MSYSILVVDDSPLIRKMMKRSLSLSKLDLGTVFEASNGKEALAVLEQQSVDVVLADIHMPVMTGTELIELMSRDKRLGKIPVIVVSAERSEPALEHLERLGIYAHLRKPFRPEQLLEVIHKVLPEAAGSARA